MLNTILALLLPLQVLSVPDKHVETVDEAIVSDSVRYGLEPYFVLRIAYRESRLDKHVKRSDEGAEGVMQLMPLTRRVYHVRNNDWRDNVRGGVRYLRDLQIAYKYKTTIYRRYTGLK